MKKRRKLDVACPNKACKCFSKIGLRNIVRNGKKGNGTQNYKCAECGIQFVRTRGTIFYHKKLNKNDVVEISRHIVETNSFRGIARETKHNKNTICSYVELIAQHCEQFNELLIHDLKLGTHEIDEFWSFVKKNKKKLPINFSRTLSKAMRTLS
ncbi:MAG: IS1 family transposase [Ignavibacteriales bacterium]|nr:IS1 family transposase [Ignavibacteriales bacterium]